MCENAAEDMPPGEGVVYFRATVSGMLSAIEYARFLPSPDAVD